MYYQVVSQCTQSLKSISAWLDKAEQFAAAKKFDVGVLLNGRLAPDMKPLIYQVQSACDYVKAAATWLSGEPTRNIEDNEQTVEELRARIRKTAGLPTWPRPNIKVRKAARSAFSPGRPARSSVERTIFFR